MCFTCLPHMLCHSRRLPFWRDSGTTFGPRNASVRKAASCWRSVAPKVLHNPLRDGPECPKGLQKLAFRPLWATLLEQIGEGAVFEKNALFIRLSSHRATPGLSTIAPLTSLEAECGPEPAFLCPLAPTGAPKRRRRSPSNVTPNGLKKRPGDLQKTMKSACCGLRGTLDALKGVSG